MFITKEPKLQLLNTRASGLYRVEEIVEYKSNDTLIVVPVGFITDLASIPKILPALMMKNTIQPAAIIHDYLYARPNLPRHPFPHMFSRKEADKIFFYGMLLAGTGRTRAKIYYTAVRMFGWKAWNRGKV
jgi:hypothetical protein